MSKTAAVHYQIRMNGTTEYYTADSFQVGYGFSAPDQCEECGSPAMECIAPLTIKCSEFDYGDGETHPGCGTTYTAEPLDTCPFRYDGGYCWDCPDEAAEA